MSHDILKCNALQRHGLDKDRDSLLLPLEIQSWNIYQFCRCNKPTRSSLIKPQTQRTGGPKDQRLDMTWWVFSTPNQLESHGMSYESTVKHNYVVYVILKQSQTGRHLNVTNQMLILFDVTAGHDLTRTSQPRLTWSWTLKLLPDLDHSTTAAEGLTTQNCQASTVMALTDFSQTCTAVISHSGLGLLLVTHKDNQDT